MWPLAKGNALDFSYLLEVILLFIMTATLISEEIIVKSKIHYSKSLQLQLQINHVSRNIKTVRKCRLLFILCSIHLGYVS